MCTAQFNFFLHNNFGTYFLTFWLFGMTLIPLGFVITAIVRKANSAAAVGFLVFLFSFVLLILGGSVYLPTTSTGVQLIFALFSPAMFAKGLNDLDYATRRDSDPGISWSARSSYSSTWPLPSLWAGFFADFCIYLLLALYLDNVVPSTYTHTHTHKMSRHPLSSQLTHRRRVRRAQAVLLLRSALVLDRLLQPQGAREHAAAQGPSRREQH